MAFFAGNLWVSKTRYQVVNTPEEWKSIKEYLIGLSDKNVLAVDGCLGAGKTSLVLSSGCCRLIEPKFNSDPWKGLTSQDAMTKARAKNIELARQEGCGMVDTDLWQNDVFCHYFGHPLTDEWRYQPNVRVILLCSVGQSMFNLAKSNRMEPKEWVEDINGIVTKKVSENLKNFEFLGHKNGVTTYKSGDATPLLVYNLQDSVYV